MHWIALTIISAFAGSVTKVLQRKLISNQDHNPAALAFIFQLLVAGLFLIYALFLGVFELPKLTHVWLPVLCMALLYGVGNIYTFKAFQKAEAAEVAVIFSSSSIWSALTAVFLLHETISLVQWAGIALITLGVTVVSFRRTNWRLNQGHWYALIAALCFGIAFTNDAFIIGSYTDVASYMVLAFGLPSFVVLMLQPKAIPAVPKFFKPDLALKLLLCAVFYALSALTIFTAYKQGGPASIISPLHQISLLFTVSLSFMFLREKDHLAQKIIGAVIVCMGAMFLL